MNHLSQTCAHLAHAQSQLQSLNGFAIAHSRNASQVSVGMRIALAQAYNVQNYAVARSSALLAGCSASNDPRIAPEVA